MKYLIHVFILACSATSALAEGVDRGASWYKPALIEDNDPACSEVVEYAQKKFLSDLSFGEAYSLLGRSSERGTMQDWKVLSETKTVSAFGKTYYLDYLAHPGCGGACESTQLLVSDKPFPEPRDFDYLNTLAEAAPPAVSFRYTIAQASENDVYLLSVSRSAQFNNEILVYKLAREGRWKPACRIAAAPKELRDAEPLADSGVLDSLNALRQSVGGLMRGAGSCGTMQTHWRWTNAVRDTLETALYRPWVIRERRPGADDGYESDMTHLEQWSLLGTSEYAALQTMREELSGATMELASFYQEANGWPLGAAEEMASTALKQAVSQGFSFYMYDPQFAEGEEELRRAILEKRDIAELRTITFDEKNIDSLDGWVGGPESRESILSVAIEHPQALSFLLQKGINPNHVNVFGKTPLMYAAQYNQIESARLLIDKGADLNAATKRPADNCYYTLRTFDMTPLHYAVRYASPELIRLLLDNGAQPFFKARNHHARPMAKETPLDWLRRYTGPDATERNPNIPDEQVKEIEAWLAPPTPAQAERQAADYVRQAEAAYRRGDVVRAYRDASLARQLQPDSSRVLSDLSLFALKKGALGESVEISRQLIESDADKKLRANAWFNEGLACERHKARGGHRYLFFNGESYCSYGVLYPYLKSYETSPTLARKNKVKALFDEHAVPYCEVRTDSGTVKINFQMGRDPESRKYRQLQTLYVLHGQTEQITGEDLAWNSGSRHFVPHKVSTLDFGDSMLSVFETSEMYVQFPYEVFGTTCTRECSMTLPKQ